VITFQSEVSAFGFQVRVWYLPCWGRSLTSYIVFRLPRRWRNSCRASFKSDIVYGSATSPLSARLMSSATRAYCRWISYTVGVRISDSLMSMSTGQSQPKTSNGSKWSGGALIEIWLRFHRCMLSIKILENWDFSFPIDIVIKTRISPDRLVTMWLASSAEAFSMWFRRSSWTASEFHAVFSKNPSSEEQMTCKLIPPRLT